MPCRNPLRSWGGVCADTGRCNPLLEAVSGSKAFVKRLSLRGLRKSSGQYGLSWGLEFCTIAATARGQPKKERSL